MAGGAVERSCWVTSRRTIDLSRRPCIMGILNVTPDSFSDGGCHASVQDAIDHALRLEDDGADIIDVGGESTRPGAPAVGSLEELQRILPVIEGLSGRLSLPISIDTYKSDVAAAALAAGAEIVNDVSAFTFDPAMAAIVAEAGAAAVLMHTRGRPEVMQQNTQYGSLLEEIAAALRHALETARRAGIAEERLVLDPGIGFGKSVEGNLEILRRLGELTTLGRPLLLGTSRKGFIGTVTGRGVTERQFGTAATVALSLMNGAAILRVHDVREMRDVADMTWAILHS
jgi:dihydropteroate synthase